MLDGPLIEKIGTGYAQDLRAQGNDGYEENAGNDEKGILRVEVLSACLPLHERRHNRYCRGRARRESDGSWRVGRDESRPDDARPFHFLGAACPPSGAQFLIDSDRRPEMRSDIFRPSSLSAREQIIAGSKFIVLFEKWSTPFRLLLLRRAEQRAQP